MSYGISRPADFDPTLHSEVFVSYSLNRATVNSDFVSVDVSKYLDKQLAPGSTTNHIGGIYNLKLPLETFNKVGIYNVYIRPKQIEVKIQDVGVLSTFPDIRGLVLKTSDLPTSILENDSLVGYRIEYYDQTGLNKINNLFRIITSSNKCEVVNNNLISSNQKSVSYRFNDASDLLFLTVTPSTSANVKPNTLPYIGNTGTKIILTNTFFNPVMVEVELTENDIETLYTSINGDQLRNRDTGIVTTFTKDGQIYSQTQYQEIKENGVAVYDMKEKLSTIDFTEDINTIKSNL